MTEKTPAILAIDTATSLLRLAVQFGDDRLVKSEEDAGRSHGQMITRKIENVVESSGAKVSDLTGLVVSTGPGSFTGLRIGIAAAKGLATALQIPLVGINLFDLAVDKLGLDQDPVSLIVPFKRDEVFVCPITNGVYDVATVASIPTDSIGHLFERGKVAVIGLTPQAAAAWTQVGDSPVLEYDASDLLRLGQERIHAGEIPDIDDLEPLYITKSQAEISFDKRQQNN